MCASGHGSMDEFAPPPVTTSLDAAVALVERVLPGWIYVIEGSENGGQAGVREPVKSDLSEEAYYFHIGSHDALNLCIALLKSLQAKEAGQ